MSPGPALAGGAGAPVPLRGTARNITPDVVERFRSMACDVTIRVVRPGRPAWDAIARARSVFEAVERACTRFDPTSPLMRANADPQAWHQVPVELFDALVEAQHAHAVTRGLFDPRVLRILEGYGYDHTLPFAAGPVTTARAAVSATALTRSAAQSATQSAAEPGRRPAWQPGLDPARRRVRLGPEPVDLGGIGKGLAVRWAAAQLAPAASSFLVEAGGDCYLSGLGPEGTGWRIGVEDPWGADQPIAVLRLVDQACTTSSVRLRHWRSGGTDVHHLIDPRTGRPGGEGLRAVTVVGPDPALAEVWSKSLFLSGVDGIERLARAQGLAALWVSDEGLVRTSPLMDELVIWRGDDVG